VDSLVQNACFMMLFDNLYLNGLEILALKFSRRKSSNIQPLQLWPIET
jgi:hypothetical protein